MYHENEFLDVEDFDEDIRLRKELIEEAKQLDAQEDQSALHREILNLRRRWKKISYRDSAYENELLEEFEAVLDSLYGKRNEGYQGNKEMKEDLIRQAKELANSDRFQAANQQMSDLMNQWRMVGSTGKESDDALWNEFNEARQLFFDRKHQHWEDMQERFANAKRIKEELIEKAKNYADSKDWQKTSDALRTLMEEWKAAGSAGREHEDQLWNEFNEYRQAFYSRRNEYYDELHEVQKEKYEQKKTLTKQAADILEQAMFTKEQTEVMKQLSVEWKKIGSCGKAKEDEIWGEFRGIMDQYFDRLKAHNEQRHAQWRERMMQIKNRKMDLIQDQKRQIKRMQDDIIGLLGERAIADMEDRIEDKQAFIAELEAEIEDLDRRLNEDVRSSQRKEKSSSMEPVNDVQEAVAVLNEEEHLTDRASTAQPEESVLEAVNEDAGEKASQEDGEALEHKEESAEA